MIRSLVQFSAQGERSVAAIDATGSARRLNGATTTYALAQAALASGKSLAELAEELAGDALDLT